jgi:prophage regulatory protein
MVPQSLSLIRRPAVLAARGTKNTKLFEDIKAGRFTPPVSVGRAATWPKHEVEALIAAQIAGKSDDEIKLLVRQLVASRKDVAARFIPDATKQQQIAS